MKLWQHETIEEYVWSESQPSQDFREVNFMMESELPDLNDVDYSFWYYNSIIMGGVRVGPPMVYADKEGQ